MQSSSVPSTFSRTISTLWHSPRSTTSSSAPPNITPCGTVGTKRRSVAPLPPTHLSQVMSPTCSTSQRITMHWRDLHITQFLNDSDTQQPDQIEIDGRALQERTYSITANVEERSKNRPDSNSLLTGREFITKCTVWFHERGNRFSVKRKRVESRNEGWNSHVCSLSPTRANPGRSKIWDPKVWRKSEFWWKLHSRSEKSDWHSRLGSQTYSWSVHRSQSS